jgi:hypothetical protein
MVNHQGIPSPHKPESLPGGGGREEERRGELVSWARAAAGAAGRGRATSPFPATHRLAQRAAVPGTTLSGRAAPAVAVTSTCGRRHCAQTSNSLFALFPHSLLRRGTSPSSRPLVNFELEEQQLCGQGLRIWLLLVNSSLESRWGWGGGSKSPRYISLASVCNLFSASQEWDCDCQSSRGRWTCFCFSLETSACHWIKQYRKDVNKKSNC